jgi:hypothetical protein
VFRGILGRYRRALILAREAGEPACQVAARELEIGRIEGAAAPRMRSAATVEGVP